MPGPPPKAASTRQRRNRTAGATTLRAVDTLTCPTLPELGDELGWHVMTARWWADVWASPMAPEYDDSDLHGLYGLAVLINDFWWAKPGDRAKLAGEIRLQRQCFGLTPIDRRRLQWEIDRGEQADESRTKRKARAEKAAPEKRGATKGHLTALRS